jgi:hypothetical protein
MMFRLPSTPARRYLVPLASGAGTGEVDERRRPGARPPRHAAAVRHDVEAQLAVGRFVAPYTSSTGVSQRRFHMNSSKCWISPSMLRYVADLSGIVTLLSTSTFTGPAGRFSTPAR